MENCTFLTFENTVNAIKVFMNRLTVVPKLLTTENIAHLLGMYCSYSISDETMA